MGTAEISLIVSGVAAAGSIGAVITTYRQGRERFNHERRLADLDAVRRVLDDAVASMERAHKALAAVTKHLDAYATRPEWKTVTTGLIQADRQVVEAAYEDMAAHHARLEIRFGSEHELAGIHNGASSTALSVAYYAHQIEQASEPSAAVAEHRESIDRAVLEFGLARDSFTRVAYRVVGVRLPAVQLAEV